MGDVAMLKVAVERIHRLWPAAAVGVVTESPERLLAHCPCAVPLPAGGWKLWLEHPYLGWSLQSRLPQSGASRMRSAERFLRRRAPSATRRAILARERAKGRVDESLGEFLEWVASAEVFVVVGAGLLTDAFEPLAIRVLELLEAGLDRGALAAMFGQGVGPIESEELERWCRRVLPRVQLIALREQLSGKGILQELGVRDEQMITTGDDAIELALPVSGAAPTGEALGVSLRRARYSEVADGALHQLGSLLRATADRYDAPIVPIPISGYERERDARVIADAVGLSAGSAEDPVSPEEVIAKTGSCRVVVTGSYHAGVFALAQGIPAIGLVGSKYYAGKFLGLSDQFDGHCAVVSIDDPGLPGRLESAVDEAWGRARELRPYLLDSARRQVRASQHAYEELRRLYDRSSEERRAGAARP